MKKILLVVLVIGLVLAIFGSVVHAGGDQVTGGTGNGQGAQETHEFGCIEQPCFSDAPQPGSGFD